MSAYVKMLGSAHVSVGEECLELPPGKTSALLYYLAYKGSWATRDELIYLFWPDSPERQGRKNLRQLLSTSRRLAYAKGLEVENNRLRWLVPNDAQKFRQAVAERNWSSAVKLYEGELLESFRPRDIPEFENWLAYERQELQIGWHESVLYLAAELEATERHQEAANLLAQAHKADPFDEPLLRRYLHTLHLGGQQDRALEVFEAFKQMLQRELSGEPEGETLRLIQGIGQGKDVGVGASVTVKAVKAPKVKHNLPLPPTPFIGRKEERAQLAELLSDPDHRLITLVGPGGIGKTRLAIEAARAHIATYGDGVFFVNLAPLTLADYIVSAIAEALKFTFYGPAEPKDQLLTYLRDKEMLLVLDNFEHIVTAAPLVAELLEKSPKLKTLVTSRIPLRLYGEQEYPVPPMTLPDLKPLPPLEKLGGYEAVRLFIERVRAVKPEFAPTTEDAPVIVEICHRLDGLPLAIELAAARIRLFSPPALLAQLVGAHGHSSLQLLTGGAQNLPLRQQTLRNTVDWSYGLLSVEEKKLFARLAVFVGGRSLEAIDAICNGDNNLGLDVLEGVDSLVGKSLLRQEETTGEPRFVMLETIHEYAREKLEESREADAVKRAHAEYFLALAEEAEPKLKGPGQEVWLERLEAEHDNLRAALWWTKENNEVNASLRLADSLWQFWWVRGYLSEGREWLERVLKDSDNAPAKLRAKALGGAGVLAFWQGDYASARTLHEKSLAIRRGLRDERGIVASLNNLGLVLHYQADYLSARSLYEEGLFMQRELGDKQGMASLLSNLGMLCHDQGDYAAARLPYEESLAIRRELGDKWGLALSLNNLGNLAYDQGDYNSAYARHEESLAMRRELGDKQGIVASLNNLGTAATAQGDYTLAHSLYDECLTIVQELGSKQLATECLNGYMSLLAMEGRAEQAVRLWGAAEAVREAIGAPLTPNELSRYEREVAAARAQLGEQRFKAAWAEGQKMTLTQAIAYALDETADG